MTYLGYRLIVNNITISNDLIQKGTYQFTKKKRDAGDWKDANLTEHQDIYSSRKADISFSLRERNLTEQDSVKDIFTLQENISVTYWDDFTCEYRTGTFYMDAPKITHRNTVGGINYAATPIHLVEY